MALRQIRQILPSTDPLKAQEIRFGADEPLKLFRVSDEFSCEAERRREFEPDDNSSFRTQHNTATSAAAREKPRGPDSGASASGETNCAQDPRALAGLGELGRPGLGGSRGPDSSDRPI